MDTGALDQVATAQLAALQKSTLYRGLASEQLARVRQAARATTRADKQFVFLEDDPATHAYLVIEGRIKLTQVSLDGQQVMLGYLGAGREFGVIALLDNATYPVSAQTVGESHLLVWDRLTLNDLADEIPMIARNALRIMARQIQYFQKRIQELSTQRVERRVARTLLRLAQQVGRKVEQGVLIDLPLTRQDLAELSGTTLFTVSRIIKGWETQGLVISQRERITILFPHGLVKIAEDYDTT